MRSRQFSIIIAIFLFALLTENAMAAYLVNNLNVTLQLNTNNTAKVTEIFNITVTNSSVSQYTTSRASINLTLSNWQSIISPLLVEHIINSGHAATNFRLLPGPIIKKQNGDYADIVLNYNVNNVTSINQTGPRILQYTFDPDVFNFENGKSGEILYQNASLNIILPKSATIGLIYPVPDYPSPADLSKGYANVTKVSWYTGEPLSKFSLKFQVTETLSEEVNIFIANVYQKIGLWIYLIIAVAVALLIIYTYLKAS